MKKLIIPFVALIVVIIVLVACSEGRSEAEADPISDDIRQICKDHNEGLEYIYNGLANAEDLSNPYESAKKLTVEYFEQKYEGEELILAKAIIDDAFGDYDELLQNKNRLTKSTSVVDDPILAPPVFIDSSVTYPEYLLGLASDSLSQAQIDVLEAVFLALSGNDIEMAFYELYSIEANMVPNLPQSEREVMYIAIEMAISSVSYWLDNYDDWEALVQSAESSDTENAVDSYWGNVGKADLGGAVAGFLFLWLTPETYVAFGINPLAGVAYVVIRTAAAGVCASAAYAVVSML